MSTTATAALPDVQRTVDPDEMLRTKGPKSAGLLVAAAVALTVGLIFLVVGDGTGGGEDADGLANVALEYFHGLTWLLLGLCFVLQPWGIQLPKSVGYLGPWHLRGLPDHVVITVTIETNTVKQDVAR